MKRITEISALMGVTLTDEASSSLENALEGKRLHFDAEKEEFTYVLKKPINMEDGGQIDLIKVCEMNGSQMRKMHLLDTENPASFIIEALAVMNGQPSAIIGRIGMRDLTMLSHLMSFFA